MRERGRGGKSTCTCTEPEITVGHWTFSDHFAQLSDHILCCSAILSEQHNFKNNDINFIYM